MSDERVWVLESGWLNEERVIDAIFATRALGLIASGFFGDPDSSTEDQSEWTSGDWWMTLTAYPIETERP